MVALIFLERRPRGLRTWIASGNWAAKIGGTLMVVGVGALLRYAAINFNAPPALKLGFGIAAFSVAYLSACSAHALFGYLPTVQGLGLLVLTGAAIKLLLLDFGSLGQLTNSLAVIAVTP